MQPYLFEFENEQQTITENAFKDPSFASNKQKPIHRWVPWIAGFSSSFVKKILDDNLDTKSIVLDPFAGVGTTLVEAILAGHDAIGFEINPYAALACKVKLNSASIDLNLLTQCVSELESFYAQALKNNYIPKSVPPEGFRTRVPFFGPRILHKVLIIQDFINNQQDPQIEETLQIAFAATMVSYSNYSYEPSLGTRKAVGKTDFEDYDVMGGLQKKLNEIIYDISMTKRLFKDVSAKVVNDSFFESTRYIQNNSVDICITSPPYLNNYHYIRNTRPQLYWLGFVKKPNDTKSLEQENFGKYWQTVRELDEVDLEFPNPPPALVKQLAYLRTQKTEKGVYGGNGWANYAASYFNDSFRFATNLENALKRGSSAFVVIGNSILQGTMIPTDNYFAEIAESAGLKLVDIHIPRPTRVGNSIIQSDVRVKKADDEHQLYEAVVELIKP
ncbi:MAG: site-specific DNA-methyltransferase [Alphaproteobacteria bacterium]|nr:MAG: site-specific DNA-methyltransferase [Alphaproteobacteria bacterium]